MMKTVLVLTALVALPIGSLQVRPKHSVRTRQVDSAFIMEQNKLIELIKNINVVDHNAEYYIVGKDYDIKAAIANFSNKKAVEHFLKMYRRLVFLPKNNVFSIFHEEIREQAIALFQVFYYAKDFDTFYNTAAWARVNVNEGMFLYTFYIAVIQREGDYVLPATYEIYPELFINNREKNEMYRIKQQNGIQFLEKAALFGVVKEKEDYVFYANYSDSLTYPKDEQKLAYFTEDVGLNSYYYYFHCTLPFWWNGDKFEEFKERRGERYFYFYQKLLARYYLERLGNGLGEIPAFSWHSPVSVGYYPLLTTWKYPFAQRSNNYIIQNENNFEDIRFLDEFEESFIQFLQSGKFKAFNKEIDLHDQKAINFVGNYWQTNADLFGETYTKPDERSYEITARKVLGAAPEPLDKYKFIPSALDFYQTSLRDPAFYQMYKKIFDYMVQFKEHLKPYNHENLHYIGVKINDVKVEKLVTYFDLFDFEVINAVFLAKDDVYPYPHDFKIRQPRLHHEPFSCTITVKSDVATHASIKLFIGPKYDSYGCLTDFEKNWMNFFELDCFTQKLIPGENKVKRKSEDFLYFKEDSLPITEICKMLDKGKLPKDMSEEYNDMPKRLMLPKGSKGGTPFQIFVFVFPHNVIDKAVETKFDKLKIPLDNKPFGYPLDRPVKMQYFQEPNMLFKDILIYHYGDMHTYEGTAPEMKLT